MVLCFNRVCSVLTHALSVCPLSRPRFVHGNLSHHGNICTKACGAVERFTVSGLVIDRWFQFDFSVIHTPLVPWSQYLSFFECMADTNSIFFRLLLLISQDVGRAIHNLIHGMFF